MKTAVSSATRSRATGSSATHACVVRPKNHRLPMQRIGLSAITLLVFGAGTLAGTPDAKPSRTWPQAYSVARDEASGTLTLRTPYYVVEQDLKKGGAIRRIALTHGKAANLLVRPLETRVRDERGTVLSDVMDTAPSVTHRREGLNEIVTVECALKDPRRPRLGNTREIHAPVPLGIHQDPEGIGCPGRCSRARGVRRVDDVLLPASRITAIGRGLPRRKRPRPFSFGSNRWGKLRLGQIRRTGPCRRVTCRVR